MRDSKLPAPKLYDFAHVLIAKGCASTCNLLRDQKLLASQHPSEIYLLLCMVALDVHGVFLI